jgi:hypothetical protein
MVEESLMTLQLLKYQRAMCCLYFDWRPYSFPIYISKYKFQPNVISDLNLPYYDKNNGHSENIVLFLKSIQMMLTMYFIRMEQLIIA